MTLDELTETSLRRLPPEDEAWAIHRLALLRADRFTDEELAVLAADTRRSLEALNARLAAWRQRLAAYRAEYGREAL